MQARPTDALLLDEGDVEAGRAAVERGGIATGSSAEDDDVELVSHGAPLPTTAGTADPASIGHASAR